MALDNNRMGYVQRKKLFELLPPHGYRYWRQDQIIEMKKQWGGSEIHLMSAEAGPQKFQGANPRSVWIDEEPKVHGEEIWDEIYARISPGQPLDIYLTFTPLLGYSWSFRKLWDPESIERAPGVETFIFSLYDCAISRGGHYTDEEIEHFVAGYSEYERRSRVYGAYSLVGGSPYFDPDRVHACRALCPKGVSATFSVDPTNQPLLKKFGDGTTILFKERVANHRYLVGVDISGGGRKDRSVAYVIDRDDDAACVARFKSNMIDPEAFAREVVFPMARYYFNATVVPEINGEYGGAFLTSLRMIYPSRIYNQTQWDRVKNRFTGQLGWRTHEGTRGMIISALERAIREKKWKPTSSLLDEMCMMVIKDNDKVEHVEGGFDDEAFAAGLAMAVYYLNPKAKRIPEDQRVEIWERAASDELEAVIC